MIERQKRVTSLQRAFVLNLIETNNPSAAALKTYNIQGRDKKHIAAVIGSQNMQKPAIKALIEELGCKWGISDESLAIKLREALEATKTIYNPKTKDDFKVPDHLTILQAIELICRLKGYINTAGKVVSSRSQPGKVTVSFRKSVIETL